MDPQMLGYLGVYVVVIALSFGATADCRRFVRETKSIDSAATLERFKAMARRNMRFALAMMVLMLPGIVAGIILVVSRGVPSLAGVLVANGALFLAGKYHAGFEKASRALPAAPELEEEYTRVGKSWVSKPLPDF